MKQQLLFAAALALSVSFAGNAHAKKIRIKHASLAPKGSPWHAAMKRVGQRWKKASGGKIKLTIYPGGVQGNEGDMLRKMRIGQLHSATLTGLSLGSITKENLALQLPMVFESYEELDYVRDRLGPRIEKKMADAGFVVLTWGDAGWVHVFSKQPGTVPADFRKLKMFLWANDPDSEKAWKAAGFDPVPMSSTDVMGALQSGLIQWFGTTPLFALSSQWFALTPHMVAIKWAPLNGATIISKARWEKIPAEIRPELMKIVKEEGAKLNAEVRALGDKAIAEMEKRSLKVVRPTPAITKAWKDAALMAKPVVRGELIDAGLYDEVIRLTEEYRSKQKK